MIELLKVGVQVSPVHSSTTDDELLRMIDSEYPALQGPLKALHDRFAALLTSKEDILPKEVECPHCGSNLNLTWKVTAR